MVADQPREGRQLPGAITSDEERDGIEPIMIQIVEGEVELDQTAAPAGDVRIVAMNRGAAACGLRMVGPERTDLAVVDIAEIVPGDSAQLVVFLEEGDYLVTALDAEGARLSEAVLIVQPQQGLPGSGEAGASPR